MALTNWDRYWETADRHAFDLVDYISAPNGNVSAWKITGQVDYNVYYINGLSANNVREGLLTFWYFVGTIALGGLGGHLATPAVLFRNQTPYAASTPSVGSSTESGYILRQEDGGGEYGNFNWVLRYRATDIATQVTSVFSGHPASYRMFRLAWWEVTGGLRIKFQELLTSEWSTLINITHGPNIYSSSTQNRVGVSYQVQISNSPYNFRLDEFTLYKKRGT